MDAAEAVVGEGAGLGVEGGADLGHARDWDGFVADATEESAGLDGGG